MKPPVENFIEQLHDLHYGTSKLERKQHLPKPLLDFICKVLEDAYYPPFREYIEKSYRAINAFRDALPPEAFEKRPITTLFTATASFPLPYTEFANFFRDAKLYPPYRRDFSEPKPGFYQYEPDDADDRRRWRDDRREYQEELADWKEQKRLYERKQKDLPKLSPVEEALLGTPFSGLPEKWEYQVPFEIPQRLRFAHQFLVGASRSGKTTFLTAQLMEDLKRVERGECSLIVMDSQNEFVPNISKLALFVRGQPLEGKLVYLEPSQYPIAANIFGGEFRANYDNVEFFLNAIFKSDVSSQQSTILKFVIQALAVIPNATISTLKDIMEDGGYAKYQKHLVSLDPVVHDWIRDKLNPKDKDFSASRTAIRNRLDGFLADPFFRAMFADPKSKLDLFEELQTPKVILINTADLGGALEPFGRYILAKLDEAMQKRKGILKASKLPVFFYIDEASDYISDEPLVAKIIDKLGKQMLGMIISIQRKPQIVSGTVLDALEHVPIQAWTIKPPVVHISVDRAEPVEVTVPLIELDKQPRMPQAEYEALRAEMRQRYGSDPVKEPQPLPRAEPAPKLVQPKATVQVKSKPAPPEDDETDAKPW